MRFFAAPVCLALAVSLPLVGQAPAAGAPTPAVGPLTPFHAETLGLTYSYPTDFVDASAVVNPAFEASLSGDPKMAATAKCLTLPLSRMHRASGQMQMLLLMRADSGCMKKKFTGESLEQFTADEARGLSASGARTDFGKAVSFEVGGKPASRLEGSFSLPTGQSLNSMVVCVLLQPNVACWQFLATTPEGVRQMGAFPVSFDGSTAPTPLVPGAAAARP